MSDQQPVFLVNMTLCTGCKACMIACKDKHDLDVSVNWRRVAEYSGGGWIADGDCFRQNIFCYYLSLSCNHCQDAICVTSCPTAAMYKNEKGIVSINENKCVGCGYCQWACPYGAPQLDDVKKVMTKCDFCNDELSLGRDPACVAACPTRALSFGGMDQLTNVYGVVNQVAPLVSGRITRPNLIIKLHRHSRPVDSNSGSIAAPEEM